MALKYIHVNRKKEYIETRVGESAPRNFTNNPRVYAHTERDREWAQLVVSLSATRGTYTRLTCKKKPQQLLRDNKLTLLSTLAPTLSDVCV